MSIFDDTADPNANYNVSDKKEPGENPLTMGAEVSFNFSTPPPLSATQAADDGLGGTLDEG
jgi:hypothetical protein